MDKKIFVIETKNTHYVLGVDENGLLRHLHWGKPSAKKDYYFPSLCEINSNHSSLDCAMQEYTVFGGTMYRACAFKCEYFDGCRDSVFTFKSASEEKGALKITLADDAYGIEMVLTYLYSEGTDIITRFVSVKNNSPQSLKIERIMSAELSLPGDEPYDVFNPNGSWGGEFILEKTKLNNGTLCFESRKGTAGHTNSPYIVLSQKANEDNGSVYFAALGYGGNFKAEAGRDFMGRTRAMLGISDFDFSYTLRPGEVFTSPKLYMAYTTGYTAMSNMMNKFAVESVLPKSFANKPLPVLYNSWEATGFDVSAENQLRLAELAKKIGCELFVMDDGWFGSRKNDWSGLGDWFVNSEKFPNGLNELIDGVNSLGMDFGLWFEPEMVQRDSDLFRAHPDWAYNYPTRNASELRHQLVLNLTKPQVKQYVFDCMDSMLSKYNIKYIKWDMNRPFSEIGTDNLENGRELWYRHTMAVYDIADRLKEKYHYLQLEACASGGGRAELGAMEHFDMVWTSDNTDPVDRLDIQRGYSFVYPTKCMRAWVTDWNKSTRDVPFDFRYSTSMQGSLSIGANLLEYSSNELDRAAQLIALYKEIRPIVQFGNLYRLKNYDENGFYANEYVSEDKNNAVLFINGGAGSVFNKQFKTISLKGLDENAVYKIVDGDRIYEKSGAFLMNVTHDIRIDRPFFNKIIKLSKKQ